MNDRRTVLVTGATGMLGTHLVARMNAEGIVPRVLLRRPYPERAWGDLRVEPVPGDIADSSPSNEEKLREACDRVATVLHLAAIVRLSGRNPDAIWRANLDGTARMHRAAHDAGVNRFVHVSTIGAVGASADGRPIDESAPWNLGDAGNPYFDSKRAAEDHLFGESPTATRRGVPPRAATPDVVMVNPSVIIGPRASVRKRAGRIEAGSAPPEKAVDPAPPWTRFLRWFRIDLPITLNLVDADDVSRGILLAADRGRPGERYLLTGTNVDFRGALDLLARWYPVPKRRIPIGRSLFAFACYAGSPAARLIGRSPRWLRQRARLSRLIWHYDHRKAADDLGYRPRPLEETVHSILG